MALVAVLSGLLIVAIGGLGIGSPSRLIALVARMQSQRGLYIAAGIRIAFGAALLLAAADSRAPAFLRVFGALALVAGVITPFFGVQRFESLLRWWENRPGLFLRAWCAVVVALGAGIIWAAAP